jgi:Sulfite reductase, alpha subunit (flavoprotein)
MTAVPYIPDNAPFSPEQRAWLNGFFAGMFSRGSAGGVQEAAVAAAPALTPLTILFGSQTGTAESLAKKAAKEAGKRSFAATVLDMAQTDLAKLAGEKNVLVITSTYGDGEPPDNAKALHTALAAAEGKLAGLRFSVCGLGDTNYTQFCRCAKDFDAWLEKAGATRVWARVECDLDYEEKFNAWLGEALGAMTAGGEPGVAGSELRVSGSGLGISEPEVKAETASGFSRQRPYAAVLVASRTLNGAGSAKQVNHVEFDLGDSGLAYEAGDALGVYAHNCPELVNEVLAALGCDGEEAVPAPDGSSIPLRRALTEFYDLGKPTAELLAMCAGGQAHHVVDALSGGVGVKIAPADLVKTLKKLQPRLYSISSSPKAHPGQVHLTVGAVRYEKDGRPRKGVCSTFLADRAQPGVTRVGVFVHANRAFRPPVNLDAPMIMVGPGTGIAPFRAFLEERRATGAKGKNWLFFGDQRAATDFLYREELDAMSREGVLTRLDTAFSRDQAEKIYVQQRMLENATELFAWLEDGAHFYVCGDASRMAKDVDAALHQVIEKAGGRSKEQAAEYVEKLKAAKRYARDVY